MFYGNITVFYLYKYHLQLTLTSKTRNPKVTDNSNSKYH